MARYIRNMLPVDEGIINTGKSSLSYNRWCWKSFCDTV